MIRGVLRALASIHRLNVVHRDLKPENIIIRRRRKEHTQAVDAPTLARPNLAQVVLVDFGLATFLDSDKPPVLKRCGTAGYFAPESLRKGESAPVPSAKLDIYSAGIILYEMIYGVNPFVKGQEVPIKDALTTNRKGKVDFGLNPIVQDFPEGTLEFISN